MARKHPGEALAPFRRAIREGRERRGLSQEALAIEVGLGGQDAVSYLENRASSLPEPETFRRLVVALALDETNVLLEIGYLTRSMTATKRERQDSEDKPLRRRPRPIAGKF